MIKKEAPQYKHYVYRDIEMIKGYRLVNETNENENIIINHIKIEINLESEIGKEFYESIKGKFTPETLSSKYVTSANYVYTEIEQDGMIHIEIKIITNKHDPKELIAKRKLLYKINKYT